MKLSILLTILLALMAMTPVSLAANSSSVFQIKMDEVYERDESSKINIPIEVSSSEGKITYYRWEQISGPAVWNGYVYYTSLSFSSPEVSKQQGQIEFTFKLRVKDEKQNETTQLTKVIIRHVNKAPNAKISFNSTGKVIDSGYKYYILPYGGQITLGCEKSSDPDDDKIDTLWEQVSGPHMELSAPRECQQSIALPFHRGQYIFQLTTTDEFGAKDTDLVKLSSSPGFSLRYPMLPSTPLVSGYQKVVGNNKDLIATLTSLPEPQYIELYRYTEPGGLSLLGKVQINRQQIPYVRKIEIKGNYIYLVSGRGDVYIFDISTPENIQLKLHIPKLKIEGKYIYYSDSIMNANSLAISYRSSDWERFVKVWKVQDVGIKLLDTLSSKNYQTYQLVENKKGLRLIVAEKQKDLKVYAEQDNRLALKYSLENIGIDIYKSNNNWLVTKENDLKLDVFDLSNLEKMEYEIEDLLQGEITDILLNEDSVYFKYTRHSAQNISAYKLHPGPQLHLAGDVFIGEKELEEMKMYFPYLTLINNTDGGRLFIDISNPFFMQPKTKQESVYSSNFINLDKVLVRLDSPQISKYTPRLQLLQKGDIFSIREDDISFDKIGDIYGAISYKGKYLFGYPSGSNGKSSVLYDLSDPKQAIRIATIDNPYVERDSNYERSLRIKDNIIWKHYRYIRSSVRDQPHTLSQAYEIDNDGTFIPWLPLQSDKFGDFFGTVGENIFVADNEKKRQQLIRKGNSEVITLPEDYPDLTNIHKGFAYSKNSNNEIEVWNIQSPLKPKLVNKIAKSEFKLIRKRFKFTQQNLYFIANESLYSVDISNPLEPLTIKKTYQNDYINSFSPYSYFYDSQFSTYIVGEKRLLLRPDSETLIKPRGIGELFTSHLHLNGISLAGSSVFHASSDRILASDGSFLFPENDLKLTKQELPPGNSRVYKLEWEKESPYINCITSNNNCNVEYDPLKKQAILSWKLEDQDTPQWIDIYAGGLSLYGHFTETVNSK